MKTSLDIALRRADQLPDQEPIKPESVESVDAPVKRFVVFKFNQYYPGGGWGDHIGSFDTIDEARAGALAADYQDYTEIVDLQTGKVSE